MDTNNNPEPETRQMAKVAVTLKLEPELIERIRNACYWIGRGLTINAIIEGAAAEAVAQLEREHNHGKPFAAREGELAKSPKKNK